MPVNIKQRCRYTITKVKYYYIFYFFQFYIGLKKQMWRKKWKAPIKSNTVPHITNWTLSLTQVKYCTSHHHWTLNQVKYCTSHHHPTVRYEPTSTSITFIYIKNYYRKSAKMNREKKISTNLLLLRDQNAAHGCIITHQLWPGPESADEQWDLNFPFHEMTTTPMIRWADVVVFLPAPPQWLSWETVKNYHLQKCQKSGCSYNWKQMSKTNF